MPAPPLHLLADPDHARVLSCTLWQFRCSQQFTDLALVCSDGEVQLHRAVLANVVKLAVPSLVGEMMECLIVPHVTTRQVEEALETLYLRLDAKQILQLLYNEKSEANEGISNMKRDHQEEIMDDFNEMLEVHLNSSDPIEEIKEEAEDIREIKPPDTEKEQDSDKSNFLPYKQDRKPYKRQCSHCDIYLKGKVAYKKHLKQVHSIEDKRSDDEEVQCQLCGKTLKHMQILKNHMKEVHGDKTFTCTTCGITLSCQRNLTTHMITHSVPSIPCEQCGKLFKRKYAVKSHIKKFHMQIKDFMCDQCDKRFADAKHLREHVIAVHDKLKPFACEMCEFKCARTDNLNVHRRKNHGILTKVSRTEHDEWVQMGRHPFMTKKE